MLTLNLSPAVAKLAKQEAARKGLDSVDAYVTDLIKSDATSKPSKHARLMAAIEEGLASGPAREWNDECVSELVAKLDANDTPAGKRRK